MKITVHCPHCKKPESFEQRVPFRAECDLCVADLHVCVNCLFYDCYAEDDCREPDAEGVANKERYNLCEYFQPRPPSGDASAQSKVEQAKAQLDALFSKPGTDHDRPAESSKIPKVISESDPQAQARAKLEALFKPKKDKD